MLWLKPHTARIQALMDEGTAESLTFAALQSRLAIEQVCYERLRNAHDYISHADLRRWQPLEIVNRLIQDVDAHAASSFTLSVSKMPVKNPNATPTLEAYEAEEYVEIGRQVGFDAKKLRSLWHAMGNFLHVKLPKSSKEEVGFFREIDTIRKKVLEVLVVLWELEQGTLISNGVGAPQTVTFTCRCGAQNKRRASLLKAGQSISCIKPDCIEQYVVAIDGEEIGFIRKALAIRCGACQAQTLHSEESLRRMPLSEAQPFTCDPCGADYTLTWLLKLEMSPSPVPAETPD